MRSKAFHALILVASSLLSLTALAQPWKPGLADEEPEPYRIKAGMTIDCLSSPFGRQLPIGLDQEPLVIRRTSGTPTIQSFVHDVSGTNLPLRSTLAYTTVNSGSTRIAVAIGRFTGDGQQQAAVVTARSNGTLALSLGWRNPATLFTEIRSTWEWTDVGAGPPTVLDLQIAAADLNGSRDGREEIVVAARWSNQTVRVFALSVADNGTIAQGTNQTLGISTFSVAADSERALRLATGDMLLEGRDQVLLLTAAPNAQPSAVWRYRILRYTDSGLPSTRFTARSFDRELSGNPDNLRRLTLHVADLGGSAAEEIVVHQQQTESGSAGVIQQRVHYVTTTRGTNNVITDFQFRDGGQNSLADSGREFTATVGELDRRPPAEIVVARQRTDNNLLQVEAYRVGLNAQGFPTSIGLANPAIVATAPLEVTGPQQLDVSVGDVDGDGIGDAFVVVRDNNRTKLRRFAIARPSPPEAPPVVGTFALRGSFDFDTALADTTDLFVRVPDWDRDGVIANIGATCRRVREPLVRTVVNLPPFWSRLQGSLGDFNAAIGRQASSGVTTETRYGTFSSHDVSGYVGLQVGGEVLGIGAQATVKATAGYNYQASRAEIRGSELTTQVTETQSQTEGGGLVVLEENTYDCFDYEVQQNGVVSDSSDLRLCELIRTNSNGDPLRTMVATDLDTWDTFTAAGTGGAGTRPAQWAPLHPDWANLALFRPVTTNVGPIGPPPEYINDGLFDTPLEMSSQSGQPPYFQIDLGEVRDITNIRLFRLQPDFTALRDLSLFVSTTPMVGAAVPTGPDVVRFDPDPQTRNGFDRWNLWTRGPAPDFEPLRGRYIRVQRTGTALGGYLTEIQVFGDTHREPPAYPQSVCDPTPNDGLFFARVLDPTASPPAYRRIHVRGDLEWTGVTAPDVACGTNHANVRVAPIWENVTIGGTGVNSWDLFTGTTNVIGRAGSISHSARVGVELDVEAGALVQVVAGGAYEWSTGVTEEESTTMYWGSGLNYSGQVRGFPGGSNLSCSYLPRPFAYRASDRSNAGYEHQFTVVDYVVRDGSNWTRLGPNLPPRDCFPPLPDPVFGNGFEP